MTTRLDHWKAAPEAMQAMLALERPSPLERAAFLLHDVFGSGFEEVAATLYRTPAAVRQLAARARSHVQQARPRFPVTPEEGRRIAGAFCEAVASGDAAGLARLLADDAILRSHGGGGGRGGDQSRARRRPDRGSCTRRRCPGRRSAGAAASRRGPARGGPAGGGAASGGRARRCRPGT